MPSSLVNKKYTTCQVYLSIEKFLPFLRYNLFIRLLDHILKNVFIHLESVQLGLMLPLIFMVSQFRYPCFSQYAINFSFCLFVSRVSPALLHNCEQWYRNCGIPNDKEDIYYQTSYYLLRKSRHTHPAKPRTIQMKRSTDNW